MNDKVTLSSCDHGSVGPQFQSARGQGLGRSTGRHSTLGWAVGGQGKGKTAGGLGPDQSVEKWTNL